jgi:GxxExxY protein
MEVNAITGNVLHAAIDVHRALGPGLLETAYEACLAHRLNECGLRVDRQVTLPVIFNGIEIDAGFRIDLLVEELVIVELKAVETMHPIFDAQLLTYLKLSQLEVGLLINFNVTRLRQGFKRMVNKYQGPRAQDDARSRGDCESLSALRRSGYDR